MSKKILITFVLCDQHIQTDLFHNFIHNLSDNNSPEVEFVLLEKIQSDNFRHIKNIYDYSLNEQAFHIGKVVLESAGSWIVFTYLENLNAHLSFYTKELPYQLDGLSSIVVRPSTSLKQKLGFRTFKGTPFVAFKKDYLLHSPNLRSILSPQTMFELVKNADHLSSLRLIKSSVLYSTRGGLFISLHSILMRPYAHIFVRIVISALREFKHTLGKLYVFLKEHIDGLKAPTLIYDPNIPIFINCRDRLSPLLELVSWLEKEGLKDIIFVDNASTYPPLLDYYAHTPYTVVRLRQNIGQTAPWDSGAINYFAANKPFIVTDPDVIPVEDSHGASKEFFRILNKYHRFKKVGFGLKIDDLPDHYDLKRSVITWESQFWSREIGENIYNADLDTTFALYRPGTPYILHPALRTGGKYVARHEPWYIDSSKLSEEVKYYREHANRAVGTWGLDENDISDLYTEYNARKMHGHK